MNTPIAPLPRHTPQPRRIRASRKSRDAASLLPLAGVILLCSPLVGLFTQSPTIFGLPSAFAYVFGVWFGLILLAIALARHISRETIG